MNLSLSRSFPIAKAALAAAVIACAFALACSLAGCASGGTDSSSADADNTSASTDGKTLRVAMELAYPPFETKDDAGNPEGLAVDFIRDFGAAYGYDMLWIPLYSFALGLFMLALATRFVTASEISVIKAQDKFHGKFFGSFATGLVACFVASIGYNFGQCALGADAVTALFSVVNINVPKNISWILLVAISVPLSLMYGSGDNPKGVKIVENAMKILIGPENVSEALQDTSVVVASYDIGNDMRGLIGVVGPTRMDYGTVAARLSGFAEGLTRLFGKHELPPKEDAKE